MTINDPDVVYTDLGLALLGAFLAWRLWKHTERTSLTSAGALLMAALASAALFGAIFHAFFPGDATTGAAYFAWIPVSLSIVVVASTLLWLSIGLLLPQLSGGVRRTLVAAYAISFAITVLFVDTSYTAIVRFYSPTIALFLFVAARRAMKRAGNGWWLLALSLALSLVAAVLQQSGVEIHPVYFDHNALYHVLQGIALVMLFVGFRRVSQSNVARRA